MTGAGNAGDYIERAGRGSGAEPPAAAGGRESGGEAEVWGGRTGEGSGEASETNLRGNGGEWGMGGGNDGVGSHGEQGEQRNGGGGGGGESLSMPLPQLGVAYSTALTASQPSQQHRLTSHSHSPHAAPPLSPPNLDPSPPFSPSPSPSPPPTLHAPSSRLFALLCYPLHPFVALQAWVQSLVSTFGLPFVAVVAVVYGVGEGYAGALYHFASQYYWMDVQGLQPAAAQAYMAVVSVPWDLRPIYGLLSDSFPIGGYRQRPYLFLSSLLGLVCSLAVAMLPSLPPSLASLLLSGTTLATAFADVLVDGLVAARIRTKPQHAGDLQALPWGILALCSLLAFALSGPIVSVFGPRGAFFFYALAPFTLLVTVVFLPEEPVAGSKRGRGGWASLKRSVQLFVRALRNRVMWRAALFLFMSHGGISPDIPTALIYWYTKAEQGPHFSKDFMGVVFAMGRVGLLIGVFLYHRYFKAASYRRLLLFTLLLLFLTGFLDLVIITRFNITLGIPDHAFVLGDTAISDAVRRLELMPILVLAARLCPPGIEATLFAFCMSVMVFGKHCGEWEGALMLHVLGVRKDSYDRLWLAVVLRNLFRLLPIAGLWLLPEGGPDSDLLGDAGIEVEGLEEESELELMVGRKEGEEGEGRSEGGVGEKRLESDGRSAADRHGKGVGTRSYQGLGAGRGRGLEVLSPKEMELVSMNEG